MHELQRFIQDENLKQMSMIDPDKAARDFDVTDHVMKRVLALSDRKPRLAARLRMRPGVALTSLILFVVMGASVTGYAASQYVELQNAKGETVLKTAKAEETTDFAQYLAKRMEPYRQSVLSQLNPGEYAAYYVKDDVMNKADANNPIQFEYKRVDYKSFGSFAQEMKRTQAPVIHEPSRLPQGYRFDYGYVYPKFMYPQMSSDKDYVRLKNELIKQSESAAKGEKLFIKKLEWDQADFSYARYAKGSDYLVISARTLFPDSKLTVFQNEQDTAEKVSIKGSDTYYIQSEPTQGAGFKSKNRLGWIDADRRLLFEIYDNSASKLNKQDLVDIAEDLIGSH